jgi:hypothetical protein
MRIQKDSRLVNESTANTKKLSTYQQLHELSSRHKALSNKTIHHMSYWPPLQGIQWWLKQKQIDPQHEHTQKKRTTVNREDERKPRTERKHHEQRKTNTTKLWHRNPPLATNQPSSKNNATKEDDAENL